MSEEIKEKLREWKRTRSIALASDICEELADTFTDNELRKLVKIDIKKIEKKVVEMIAERVVGSCMKSSAFMEKE